MIFKHTRGSHGRAMPEGGYGSANPPSKAMTPTPPKNKPGKDSGKSHAAHKPAGGYGTYGKPKPKGAKAKVTTGNYATDDMSWPEAKIPTDTKKLFNLPRVKVPRR